MTAPTMYPPWVDRRAFPFVYRSIDIEGHRIHYVDEGSGPTLLMLHGNASWSFLYRLIIRRLSRRFRCIALDYPGFGLSKARAGYAFTPVEHSRVVEAFVGALDLHDIRLMVQDWGGPIGLGFAGRRPERIRSLVICNTWAWPAQGTGHVERYSRAVGGALGAVFVMGFNGFIRILVPAFVRHRLSPAERAAYRGPFPTIASRYPLWKLAREILGSRDYLAAVEAGLAELHGKPVALLWGDADTAFGAVELERFRRIFPTAVTRMLHGARHFVQEDAPDEICSAIEALEDERERHASV